MGAASGDLLATDFLGKYILLIDFPNSQIGFLPADAKLKDLAKPKTVKLMLSEDQKAFL